MRAYSMSYKELLTVPIRTFWHLFAQIHRLQAQEDLRRLDVMIAQNSPEGAKQLREHLEREVGEPIKKKTPWEGTFDADGWNALKGMQHDKIGA